MHPVDRAVLDLKFQISLNHIPKDIIRSPITKQPKLHQRQVGNLIVRQILRSRICVVCVIAHMKSIAQKNGIATA